MRVHRSAEERARDPHELRTVTLEEWEWVAVQDALDTALRRARGRKVSARQSGHEGDLREAEGSEAQVKGLLAKIEARAPLS